jgi:hypothetical protein
MRIISQIFGFVIFSIPFSNPCYSTSFSVINGAREAGMANASVSLSGPWSVFNNPAGMAMSNHPSCMLNYNNRFQLKELSTASVAGVIPKDFGSFGVSASYFGTSRYNEQKFAFGYARSLGEKISAGILCDYFVSKLPSEYETGHTLAGEIGLIVIPVEKLNIGFHVFNISGSKFKTYETEELPVLLSAGVSWQDEAFLLSSQIQLSNKGKTCLSLGSEIILIKNLFLCAGISNSEQMRYSFGLGYKLNRFECDIAFTNHPVLGFSSDVSLLYNFSGKNR